jgi:hypothetical protein
MITDTDLRYVGTDCKHDPGDLVTKHRRRRNEIMSCKEQVSVTQPGRLYVDENFAPNGRGDIHILDLETATERVNYQRFHMASLQSPSRHLAFQSLLGRAVLTCQLAEFSVKWSYQYVQEIFTIRPIAIKYQNGIATSALFRGGW